MPRLSCSERVRSKIASFAARIAEPHPVAGFGVARPRSEPISDGGDPHRHLAGHLAGGVPAHAVGDDEHAPVGEHEVVVFVARADDADVGSSGTGEVHRCPRQLEVRNK